MKNVIRHTFPLTQVWRFEFSKTIDNPKLLSFSKYIFLKTVVLSQLTLK